MVVLFRDIWGIIEFFYYLGKVTRFSVRLLFDFYFRVLRLIKLCEIFEFFFIVVI